MSWLGLQSVLGVFNTRISAHAYFFIACVIPFSVFAQSPSQRLVPRLKGYLTSPYGYWEYLPQYYSDSSEFPVVIYLHGIKEVGSGTSEADLQKVLLGGPPSLIAKTERNFPFVLICPQSPGLQDGFAPEQLSLLIDIVKANYRVDAARIYITGISYGGYATWRIAEHIPDKIAGIIPISSCGDITSPQSLRNVAVFAFTNSGDYSVPGCMYDVVTKIRAEGGNPLLKIYNDKGHNAWSATYRDNNVWNWLLAQKKPKKNESCAPVIVPIDDQTVTIGYPHTIELRASDLNNDELDFVVDEGTLPAGVTFTPIHNGYARLSVASKVAGSHLITITVRDKAGNIAKHQFQLTMVPSPLFVLIVLLFVTQTVIFAWILFKSQWMHMISLTSRKTLSLIDLIKKLTY
jgi:hypothetical protein